MEIDMQRSFNTDLVDDAIFSRQNPDAKLVYYTLYMHPRNHFVGLFQIRAETLAMDIGISVERVKEAMAELIRNDFIMVQPDLDLVWVKEMRRVLGKDLGKKLTPPAARYLNGLRPCRLVSLVAESLGIPYTGFSPTQDDLYGESEKTGIGSKAKAISNTSSVPVSESDQKPPALPTRVADHVPIPRVEAPKKEWRRPFEELASGPLDALGALDALLIGLAPGKPAWEAVEAKQHVGTTGLPGHVENQWFGVWTALRSSVPPPTADDMRKLGQWWAGGGAPKCRRQRFNYLGSIERMTEWLEASRAWDGESDPSPDADRRPDERHRAADLDDRPAHISHTPYHETDAYRLAQEQRRKLEQETPEQREATRRMVEEGFACLGLDEGVANP